MQTTSIDLLHVTMESFIDATPFGIIVFDVTPPFTCLRHNSAFLSLAGKSLQQRGSLVGLNLKELMTPASWQQLHPVFEQVRDTGIPIAFSEYTALLAGDEETRWFTWNLSPLFDDQQRVIALLGSANEITELVRARDAQRQEAARLATLLHVMPAGVSLYDAAGHLVQQNPAAERITGKQVQPQESSSARHSRYVMRRPDGLPLAEDETPSGLARRGETFTDVACVIQGPDGKDVDLLTSGAPLRDEQGALTGAVVIFQDVTAHRSMERETLTQAAELEGIFAALSAAVVVFDGQGHITRLNPAAAKLYEDACGKGYDTRPMTERSLGLELRDSKGALLPPEHWPAPRILHGEIINGEDVQYRNLDGTLLTLVLAGVPLRAADGTITGGITIYQDVTERRALEQRTHASLNALLRMAQETVDAASDLREVAHDLAAVTCEVLACRRVGVMAIEAETQFVRPLAVMGLSPEEERQWWDMQPPDTRFGEGGDPEVTARFAAGEMLVLDMTEPPYSEQPNPFEITTALFVPMRLEGQLVGFISLDHAGERHDYTPQELALAQGVADLAALVIERQRLQHDAAAARARALASEETNARMHTFLGIAGHELRTPVTSIKSSVQLTARAVRQAREADLPDDLRGRMERAMHLLEGANDQADKLNRFITDLLDVTRIQTGSLEMHVTQVDLAEIARQNAQAVHPAWPHRTIYMEVPDARFPVEGDADRLGQVVTNLLTNALKYSPDDTPVEISLTRQGQTARVAVTDHGPGLAPVQQERLFQAFSRVEGIERLSGAGVGLGLGLFICKTIIDRLHGTIGVTSQPGQGATFWFTLPLVEEEEA